MPKLTVQIVTWNSRKYISYLFASLRAQTFRDWELVVWDNASDDDTVACVQKESEDFPVPVRITKHTDDSGFAYGHNRLFQTYAESEYVLLLNPDMYLLPDCFSSLVTCLDTHKDTAAVSPRLMRWDFEHISPDTIEKSFTDQIDTLGLRVFRSRRVIDDKTGQSWSEMSHHYGARDSIRVFGVSGALPMYRRSSLTDVMFTDGTLFDEVYVSYKEDVDLAFRLVSHGFTSRIVVHTAAYHDRTGAGPKSLSDWSASVNKRKKHDAYVTFHSYKNHLATIYKNEYWQNFLLDFPWIFWYEGKKFLWFLVVKPAVLCGLIDMWDHRTILRVRRADIRNKRTCSWRDVRTYWTHAI